MLSSRRPRQRHRILRAGGMVSVYRATLDAIRDAQHEGVTLDVEAAERAAAVALCELETLVFVALMRLRMERAW